MDANARSVADSVEQTGPESNGGEKVGEFAKKPKRWRWILQDNRPRTVCVRLIIPRSGIVGSNPAPATNFLLQLWTPTMSIIIPLRGIVGSNRTKFLLRC